MDSQDNSPTTPTETAREAWHNVGTRRSRIARTAAVVVISLTVGAAGMWLAIGRRPAEPPAQAAPAGTTGLAQMARGRRAEVADESPSRNSSRRLRAERADVQETGMSKHKKHHYHSHDRRPQFERAPARRGISPTAVVLASITYSLRSRAHAGRDGVVEQPAILSTFRKLAAATEEFATGCPGGHLPAIRARARDVGIASARLEDVLRQIREAKR